MIPRGVSAPAFWAAEWERRKKRSVLRLTQDRDPEKWRAFYDAAAADWDAMSGDRRGFGMAAADLFLRAGLIGKGSTVLDVGCGSGAMAIPLAAAGARVTALDDSPGMISALKRAAHKPRSRAGSIRTRLCPWDTFDSRGRFDLVLAASFPTAWDPEGLSRLEGWSRGWCALTLGEGGDPFPFRAALWKRVMGPETPERSPALQFLFNYLSCLGRRPSVDYLSVPVALNVALDRAVRFYASYFSIFKPEAAGMERTVSEILGPCSKRGRLKARGSLQAAVLWWQPGRNAE